MTGAHARLEPSLQAHLRAIRSALSIATGRAGTAAPVHTVGMTFRVPTVSLPGGDLPMLGLGTWTARGDECYRAVRHALDIGYRHLDTATGYANEHEVGRALADSGVPRAEVFVTTKLPPENAGRERETITASLRALALDYVDLWLIHWPPRGEASPWVWEQFVELRSQGLTRSIGVSNYSVEQVDILSGQVGETPAVDQIPWSPSDYDPQLAHQLASRGVVLEGYSPLLRTELTAPALVAVADAHGASPAQVVLRWHLDRGFVAIPKSVHPARIEENFALDFVLSDGDLAAVDALGVSP